MSIRFPVQLMQTFAHSPVRVEKPVENPPVVGSFTSGTSGFRHPAACQFPSLADYQRKNIALKSVEPGGVSTEGNAGNLGLKKNADIESYISKHSSDFVTPEKEIATILSAAIKQRWGMDIDPDRTYLVTFKKMEKTRKMLSRK